MREVGGGLRSDLVRRAFVSGPPDYVAESSIGFVPFVDLAVYNFRYFIFEFAFQLDWWWRFFGSSWERIRCRRFKELHVEYVM